MSRHSRDHTVTLPQPLLGRGLVSGLLILAHCVITVIGYTEGSPGRPRSTIPLLIMIETAYAYHAELLAMLLSGEKLHFIILNVNDLSNIKN